MDYLPPPVVHQYVLEVANSKKRDPLIISVDAAKYDEDMQQASITMFEAFQASHKIEFYRGSVITLVYRDASPDLQKCPSVDVPIEDIKREVDYAANEVTITISNISKTLAESIERNLCLFIDTDTVKKVANPDFMSAGERAKRKKRWFFLNR